MGDWLWVICQDESGWTFASTTEGWCGWYPTSSLEFVGEEGEATEQAELNTRSEGENWDWNDGIEEGAYPVSSYAWDENPDGFEQDGYREDERSELQEEEWWFDAVSWDAKSGNFTEDTGSAAFEAVACAQYDASTGVELSFEEG